MSTEHALVGMIFQNLIYQMRGLITMRDIVSEVVGLDSYFMQHSRCSLVFCDAMIPPPARVHSTAEYNLALTHLAEHLLCSKFTSQLVVFKDELTCDTRERVREVVEIGFMFWLEFSVTLGSRILS